MKGSPSIQKVILSILSVLSASGGAWMLTRAFPPHHDCLFIYVGFVPIFLSVIKTGRIQAVVNACIAGGLYYVLMYRWLRMFHASAVLFISLLFGIIFFALPLLCGRFVYRRGGPTAFILMPVIWVFFEYLKTLGPLSFGFGIVGYSQYRVPLLIQSADMFGVWGLSFLIIFTNSFICMCFLFFLHRFRQWYPWRRSSVLVVFRKEERRNIVVGSAVILACWSFFLIYGYLRLNSELETRNIRIQLAQFIHDAKVPWAENRDHYLDEYEQFFLLSAAYDPDLLILPENAVKRFVSVDPDAPVPGSADILNRLSGLAKDHGTALLVGMLEQSADGGEVRRYNTAFLFDRNGDLAGRYRKHVLAPFGETDPFHGIFPGLEEMLARETDIIRLDRGLGKPILEFDSADGRYSLLPLICFEGTSGRFVGSYIGDRAVDFLVVMTSDAWTESAAALLQHGAFAVFRAVETRKTVFRVGNGGLTCVINPKGVIVRQLPLFMRATLLSGLPVMASDVRTLYMRWGDWIPLVCAIVLAGYAITRLMVRKKL